MRTKVTLLLVLTILLGTTSYAQESGWRRFWKGVGKVVCNLGEAVVVGGTANLLENYGGYSKEEAQNMSASFYRDLGANQTNVERGIAWSNAENTYQKQNVAKDFVIDKVFENSPEPEYVEVLRTAVSYGYGCLDEAYKGNKDKATVMAILGTGDILFQMQRVEAEKNKALWEEEKAKQEMRRHLQESGVKNYTESDVNNCVNYVLAVATTDKLSDKKKSEYLSKVGITQSPLEVLAQYGMDNQTELLRQEELRRQKEEEERRRAEERRLAELKAAEERRNALQSLGSMKIDGFAFDVTELSDEQKPELDEAASILNKYSDVNVLLTGHTCKIGYKSINQKKGMKRAEAAKEYLISKGVAENRITVDSKGKTEPLVPNTSKENYKQNRRVEIQVK